MLLSTCASTENGDFIDADLFEGDIVLEPVQRLAVDLGIEIRSSMGNRPWPNGIVPYTIAPSLCKKRESFRLEDENKYEI